MSRTEFVRLVISVVTVGVSKVTKIVSIPNIVCIVVTENVCKLILCEVVIGLSILLLLITRYKEVLKILCGCANPCKG